MKRSGFWRVSKLGAKIWFCAISTLADLMADVAERHEQENARQYIGR
jgi:hypothetical protein